MTPSFEYERDKILGFKREKSPKQTAKRYLN